MSAWTKKKLNQAWKQCKKKLTSGFVSGQPSEFVSGQQRCSTCNSVIYEERLARLEHAVFSKKQCHDDENIFDIYGHGEEDKADEMDGHGEEDKLDENLPLMEVLSTLKSKRKRTKKSPQPKPSPSLKRKNKFGTTYARRKKTSTISSSTGAPPTIVSDVISEKTSPCQITGPDRAIVTRRKLLVLDINGVLACVLHGMPHNGFQNYIPIYIPSDSETQTEACMKSGDS